MVGRNKATPGRFQDIERRAGGPEAPGASYRAPRLAHAERREQLLKTALGIVRDDGVDQLTLGRLAVRAGVSKPVAYDHFATRSELLIALYRWIDTERVEAFSKAMAGGDHGIDETIRLLAQAYIHCASETDGEFQAVGAALAGSAEKAVVFEELLGNCVKMFAVILAPHSTVSPAELERRCVGFVGAGEALAAALIRGDCSDADAQGTFAAILKGAMA